MVRQKFVLLCFLRQCSWWPSINYIALTGLKLMASLLHLFQSVSYRAGITFRAWNKNLYQGFRAQLLTPWYKVVASSEKSQLLWSSGQVYHRVDATLPCHLLTFISESKQNSHCNFIWVSAFASFLLDIFLSLIKAHALLPWTIRNSNPDATQRENLKHGSGAGACPVALGTLRRPLTVW